MIFISNVGQRGQTFILRGQLLRRKSSNFTSWDKGNGHLRCKGNTVLARERIVLWHAKLHREYN